MKKIISFCLVALMLVSVLPVGAFAAQDEQDEREQLLAQACSVFPEYAAAIRGEAAATYSLPASDNRNEVVFTETREISDTETLSITQMASGDIIVTQGEFEYLKVETTDSSVSDVGPDKIGYASFKATCTDADGVFYYKNVGFIIHQNGSGFFTSYGTASTSGDASKKDPTETATYIRYGITYNVSKAPALREIYNFTLSFSGGKLQAMLSA